MFPCITAKFTKTYNKHTLASAAPVENQVTVEGDFIRDDAVITATKLTSADSGYTLLNSKVPDTNKLVVVYDVKVTSAGRPDLPFLGVVTMKLYVGKSDYAGKKVNIYHGKSDKEVEYPYENLVVDSEGYVTLNNVTSFSPYGVVASTASGNPNNNNNNNGNDNNNGGNNDGTSNNSSNNTTLTTTNGKEGKTGDNSISPIIVASIMGVALVVLIITGVSIKRKKK